MKRRSGPQARSTKSRQFAGDSSSRRAVLGNEGVGLILAIGTGVANVEAGDRVLLPLYSNTWRERVVVPAAGLVPLPPEADVRQLAMLRINPPAGALMLSEYVDLRPGDWVLQNGNSAQFARI